MKIVTTKHREAVAALEAEHGPDAELTATVQLPAAAEVVVAGDVLEDWTGAMMGARPAAQLDDEREHGSTVLPFDEGERRAGADACQRAPTARRFRAGRARVIRKVGGRRFRA